jgi:hypothetical protein
MSRSAEYLRPPAEGCRQSPIKASLSDRAAAASSKAGGDPYDKRPAWLDTADRGLDAALAQLLKLNRERSAKGQ